MNKFKKFLAVALSLCLIGGCVSSLGACEKEEPQTPPPVVPQTVDFTVSVKTDKGVAVEGVQFVLWANLDNSKTDLETNSEGKATVNVAVGEYDLELNSESLPEMHFPDKYKWTLDISESVTSLEIVLENVAPDGTLEKPYYFAVSDDNQASVTLPASATVYYELRNLSGASMFIQTQGVEVVYKGVTYTYDAQKNAVEVPLEKTDTSSRVKFALVNKTDAELTVNAVLQVPEGSLENPIVLTTLGEVTVEVKGTGQVYYQWTASEAGTFTVTSNSQDSYISVTNKTQVSSETVINREGQDQTLKTTIEIAVNAGDVISIEASAFGAENGQEYSYEINFGFQALLS